MKWDIKVLILQTGMKQKEFAEKAQISETHLSSIANGRRPKSLDQALKIARLLGKTVEELWPLPEDDTEGS